MIKTDPELRHALSHILLAIKALSESVIDDDFNKAKLALYELHQVQGLIMYLNDDDASAHAGEWYESMQRKDEAG